MSSDHTYQFNVKMSCGGCSGAVTRVLEKAKNEGGQDLRLVVNSLPDAPTGVKKFDVSLEKQEVTVEGTLPYDDVLQRIKKTGKEVVSGKTIA